MAITEIEDKIEDIIEQDNHEEFIFDFLSVYNFPKSTITKLRKGLGNLAKEPGEIYLKNRLYYKSVNTDGNLMQTFTDIKAKIDELGSKPRYIMVTDFKDVLAYDVKTQDTLSIPFERLPQKFEFFLAWNGIEKADFDKENPADIRAAERFAKLYDVIVKDNPNATRKGLNLFLIRVLFCLFAEDTNIFTKNLFTNRVKQLTKVDGSDLDDFINQLFSILDVKKEERPKDTPSWLVDFQYVDGDLFKELHESLKFTAESRKLIIDAGEKLEWDQINPDILGSMMQAVASEDSRSHLGMHYTSVPNIMKVIKPLFLDDLRTEFDNAKGDNSKLNALYERIGKIKFMDPACGSGNFLIVTYKQLRQLEIDILKEQNNLGYQTMYLPSVTLDQFYGIEIDDFACDTTRLSLWIAEHQMNVKLHEEIQDAVRPTLPLQHAGAIVCGNALRMDWNEVMPHTKNDEIYLFGNPPYLGSYLQSDSQKEDIKKVFSNRIKGFKKLDYIAAWFMLAAEFCARSNCSFAFVTTNSINQGEQVPILWPYINKKLNLDIFFAYPSFRWTNNAKANAQVIVSIIGITSHKNVIKKIYKNNRFVFVDSINPYLTATNNIIVRKQNSQICGLPEMLRGNMPTDGGGFILNSEEFKIVSPEIKPYVKKFVGSKDLINGKGRYVLWLNKSDYLSVKDNDFIRQRINIVRNMRLKSKKKSTNKLADEPWKFEFISQPQDYEGQTLVIPRVSSKNRKYLPLILVDNNTIVSDTCTAIYNASLFLFGLLESKMHLIWLRNIGGRLKTDYRYSSNLVYNTFPVPEISLRRKKEIEELMLNILDIRNEEGGTLADLYGSPLAEKNPKPMNPRLLAAHQELDQVVDRAYKDRPFKDDNERLSILLDMYSKKVDEINEQK